MSISSAVSRTIHWLTGVLNGRGIPYQVVGGLAARFYGARRPLVDIDLYVPDSALQPLAGALAPYITRFPKHHRDEHWDITFMQLQYGEHTIEIGGADSALLYDRHRREWRSANIGFDRSVRHEVAGVALMVIPLDELLAYKRMLGRDVDQADLAALAGA